MKFDLRPEEALLRIEVTVNCSAQTGAEMEALTGATVASLTVYDMCKGIEPGIVIERIRLERKSGGKLGTECVREAKFYLRGRGCCRAELGAGCDVQSSEDFGQVGRLSGRQVRIELVASELAPTAVKTSAKCDVRNANLKRQVSIAHKERYSISCHPQKDNANTKTRSINLHS